MWIEIQIKLWASSTRRWHGTEIIMNFSLKYNTRTVIEHSSTIEENSQKRFLSQMFQPYRHHHSVKLRWNFFISISIQNKYLEQIGFVTQTQCVNFARISFRISSTKKQNSYDQTICVPLIGISWSQKFLIEQIHRFTDYKLQQWCTRLKQCSPLLWFKSEKKIDLQIKYTALISYSYL